MSYTIQLLSGSVGQTGQPELFWQVQYVFSLDTTSEQYSIN